MPVSRRTLLLNAVAAPAALQAASPAQSAGASTRPNILFILSDDHSVPFLGAYGADYLKSPNLDRLAREGMRLDRCFTAAPQCVPSRTAIMTGISPVAARMGSFSNPLPPDVVSAPELLRAAGYYTGVCGRWYHLDGQGNPPAARKALFEKHGMLTWQNRVDFLEPGNQVNTAVEFDRFLSRVPDGKPWWFWINYSDPHHRWDDNAGTVKPSEVRVPAHLPDLPGVREELARYCGEVERMDGFVGEAIAALRRRGQADNTLVVFMGDNGMAFPHGKGSLYDPGLNVPLIAWWPGRIPAGSASTFLISGEDLTPTFLAAAGLETPKHMTGRSFLNLLTGAPYQQRDSIFAARLTHANGPFTASTKASNFDLSRCVRDTRYKLIYNCTPQMEYWPVDSGAGPGWQQILEAHRNGMLKPEHERAYFQRPRPVLELYDLEADPAELHNLADKPELAAVQRRLLLLLEEKMFVDRDFLPPPTDGR